MPIQDTDLFLIEDTSGGSNKIEASKLKANLAANTYNDYLLLVNKSDYSACFVKAQNMQGSVEPTDYMMIERGGVSYSVTGQQIIDYFPSTPAGQAGPITDTNKGTDWTRSSTFSAVNDNYYTQDYDNYKKTFDGSLTTSWNISRNLVAGTPISGTIEFNPPLNVTTSFRAYIGGSFDAGPIYLVEASFNDGVTESAKTVVGNPAGSAVDEWVLFTTSGQVKSITVYTDAGNAGWGAAGPKAIELDGVVLVDDSQKLTLASATNLGDFVNGDAINMVDVDGAVASYVPVTSTITNVNVLPVGLDNVPTSGLTNASIDAILSAYGVTHITGFGLENRGTDEYTLELTDFKKDGVGVVTTATTTLGAPYIASNSNTFDWQTFFSPSKFRCQGISFVTYACVVSPQIPVVGSSFQVSCGGIGGALYVLDQNGNKVYVVGGEPKTSLTLTDGQDLKYFKPGDAVQTYGITYVASAPPAAAGDPFANAGDVLAVRTNTETTITFTFPSPVDFSTIRKFRGGGYNQNEGYTVKFTDELNNEVSGSGITVTGWSTTDLPVVPPNLVKTFSITGSTGYAFQGFYDASSIFVPTGTLGGSSIVISTDTTSNTMILNGGAWTGSDGSSSGEAVDRETEATAPTKSGTGNFNGNTGPVVDVTNSNGDWIDNQNRLGEAFYIKAASTRTGLAVLRAKAIAQAQAWVASDNYVADQLVTYDGRYWIALASSYYNSPDSGDELEWFDLGAI